MGKKFEEAEAEILWLDDTVIATSGETGKEENPGGEFSGEFDL